MSAFEPDNATPDMDLESLRTGLAELDRSPDLEDAITAIAREAHDDHRGTDSPRLLRRVIAVAAALVILGFVLYKNRTVDRVLGEAGEEGTRARATLSIPPTAAQVAAARRANELPEIDATTKLRYGYRCEFDGGGMFEMWTDEHIAPIPKARQRWVVDRMEGIPSKAKHLSYMSFPQEEGVLLMGPELLVPEDAMTRGAGKQLEVLTKDGTWRPIGGSRFLELTIGSPEDGGSTARVQCVLSTAYTGTLLVPNRMARALGLNHFELPGGFVARLGGKEAPILGQRALARIRIPELKIDRVAEVQVREEHNPRDLGRPPKTGMKNHGAIVVEGALPSRVAHCDVLSIDKDGTVVVQTDGDGEAMTLATDKQAGPLQLGIWNRGAVHLGLLYDAKGDRPAATVVLGAYAFENKRYPVYGFKAQWVTALVREEPGARVTIAKVWRGTKALPSAEGVVVTKVGKDGQIHFPRVAGEQASKLRMLVEGKNGSSFHDVGAYVMVDVEFKDR